MFVFCLLGGILEIIFLDFRFRFFFVGIANFFFELGVVGLVLRVELVSFRVVIMILFVKCL